MRCDSLFMVGASVQLFVNCSGGISASGPVVKVSGPLSSPADFLTLTAWVETPLLLALVLPAILVTAAGGREHPHAEGSDPGAVRRVG